MSKLPPLPQGQASVMVQSYYGNEWMHPTTGYRYFNEADMQAYAAQVVEMCAKVCEANYNQWNDPVPRAATRMDAAAIRSLLQSTKEDSHHEA